MYRIYGVYQDLSLVSFYWIHRLRFLYFYDLIHVQHFSHLKNQVVNAQPTEFGKQKLLKDFDEILLKDLQFTLEPSSKDKFSQNLNLLLGEVKKYICNW